VRRTIPTWGLPGLVAFCVTCLIATAARAQERVWLQIEAQPTRAAAEARARAYAERFPDVAGFVLPSGWHAVLLGPSSPEAARERLRALRREGSVPADSFVVAASVLGARFWPPEETSAAPEPADAPEAAAADPGAVPAAVSALGDPAAAITDLAGIPAPPADPETPAEAGAAEAALSQAEREEVQTALQWFGLYEAAIDGLFGRGSRAAMSAWQEANAAEPTGVLTTAQRRALLARYRQESTGLGLAPLREPEAGIEIVLPLALVRFDRYEPPFAVFEPAGDSGVQVLLISQPGDRATLAGLYDTLQALPILPPEGAREIGDTSFTLSGRDARVESYAYAELAGGLVKGYLLVWPLSQGDGLARVLPAMQASFRSLGDRALDPGLAPLPPADRAGLLAGLEPRRPVVSRSGFFTDAGGTVLTTPEVEAGCARLTIDGSQDMDVALRDPEIGLLVLTPRGPLSPPVQARFQTAPERVGAEIAVAGYSYEDALPAPALTFGRIAALAGLAGEPGIKRLDLAALPGDAGGPVVDSTGAVIGMLLPADTGHGRLLPEGVAFAATAGAIADRLGAAGLAVDTAAATGALPPEDLARRARGMTVLVSCWD
jgi:peptidoglycan hydrolase-like protein with peptidoglycan-binding domain